MTATQKALTGAGRKRKGARRERQTVALLEAAGYACTKAGGSLGLWDIIALGPKRTVVLQVKSNRMPSAKELAALSACQTAQDVLKLVVVWHDRRPVPEIWLAGSYTWYQWNPICPGDYPWN